MTNLSKKLLAATFLTLFSTASFADNSTAGHNLTVIVPEVALLDIITAGTAVGSMTNNNDTAIATEAVITCVVDIQAGAVGAITGIAGKGFTCTTAGDSIGYAITANREMNASTTRNITVQLDDADLDSTWDLTVTTTTGASTGAGTGVTDANLDASFTTAVEVVAGITNVVSIDGTIAYTLAQATANQAMAYTTATTGKTFIATYTIGDDV